MNKIDRIDVFYDGTKAGYLERNTDSYSFRYASQYLSDSKSLPISCSLPLSGKDYISQGLHSFFKGLEPQGWYRNALLNIDKIDRKDTFTLLGVNGLDLPGAVELKVDEQLIPEISGKDYASEANSSSVQQGVCLICLKECKQDYHNKCLQRFFETTTEPLIPLTRSDFSMRVYADIRRASISGMQVKIGVNLVDGILIPQAINSRYILKPAIADLTNSAIYEHLSMRITEKLINSKVSESALVKLADNSLAYITKRFDRQGVLGKRHFEDFGQILDLDQFSGSYEEVVEAIKEHSSPVTAAEFLFALMVQFYLGNDDFHLKNIALVDIQKNGKYRQLAPLYDCINTESLLRDMPGHSNEMVIDFFIDHETPVYTRDGHSSYQTFQLLYEKAGISEKLLENNLKKINTTHQSIEELIQGSLLNDEDKNSFIYVLSDRLKKLNKRA